jgi:hypothetical protein
MLMEQKHRQTKSGEDQVEWDTKDQLALSNIALSR